MLVRMKTSTALIVAWFCCLQASCYEAPASAGDEQVLSRFKRSAELVDGDEKRSTLQEERSKRLPRLGLRDSPTEYEVNKRLPRLGVIKRLPRLGVRAPMALLDDLDEHDLDKRLPRLGKRLPRLGARSVGDEENEDQLMDENREADEIMEELEKRLPRLGIKKIKRLPRLGKRGLDVEDDSYEEEKSKRLPRLGLRSSPYLYGDENVKGEGMSFSDNGEDKQKRLPRIGLYTRASPFPRVGRSMPVVVHLVERASPFPRLGQRASPFPRVGLRSEYSDEGNDAVPHLENF